MFRPVNACTGYAGQLSLFHDRCAVRICPGQGHPHLLFICDHASNALPQAYGDLGLEAKLFGTHIACDIGAAEVTRTLAAHFGARAVLARWSAAADRSQSRPRTIRRW
ncbi:MAG: hypothetical protein WDM89_05870 [Rhizomicrobium sp.]